MNDFNTIYEKIYNKYGKELEKSRKNLIYGLIIAVSIGVILSIISKQFIFTAISFVIVLCVWCFFNNRYNLMFKNQVVKTFVKEYCETLDYNPTMGMSKSIYNDAQFENYDVYSSEDLICGMLNGEYPINMAEIHTQTKTTDEEGHSTYSTIFYGLFAQIELSKMINANIQIRKNSINFFDKRQKLEMDSAEFEKIYDLYTTDKIIAMQLFTSDIMQMLIDFKEENKIKPEITLQYNKLYVRFSTGNVFESKLMKKAYNYKVLYKYYNIINFTLNLVDKLAKNIKETEV